MNITKESKFDSIYVEFNAQIINNSIQKWNQNCFGQYKESNVEKSIIK